MRETLPFIFDLTLNVMRNDKESPRDLPQMSYWNSDVLHSARISSIYLVNYQPFILKVEILDFLHTVRNKLILWFTKPVTVKLHEIILTGGTSNIKCAIFWETVHRKQIFYTPSGFEKYHIWLSNTLHCWSTNGIK